MSHGGSCAGTKCSAPITMLRCDQLTPFISMETDKHEDKREGCLGPVLSHSLYPPQASAEVKTLYAALE